MPVLQTSPIINNIRNHDMTRSFFVVAIIQYPAYGLLLGISNLYRKLLICGLVLAIVHVVCVIASFAFADRYFFGLK